MSARYAALALALVLFHTSIIAADSQAATAYKRGLAYLIGSQNKNGSWGSFESPRADEVWLDTSASYRAFGDATTALCVQALILPAREDKAAQTAVEKGLRYLIDIPQVVRASGTAMYDTWSHIYVLQTMAAVLKEDRLKSFHADAQKCAERELKALNKLQGSEGGWGYYDFEFAAAHPTGNESCSFITAAALAAFSDCEGTTIQVPEQMKNDALKSLVRLKLGTGAYIYGVYVRTRPEALFNCVQGSLGRSQCCNLALWLDHVEISQSDIRAGLDNLFKYHEFIEMGKGRPVPHESWYYTAGYYFFYGHYYAARLAQQLPPDEARKYGESIRSVITRLQDPDGSWWDFPLYGYHKAYGTAFALMTLQLTGY